MTKAKAAVLGFANAFGATLFCLGLLSPLTPSEGVPGPVDFLIFVGVPLAIILYTVASVQTPWLRAVLVLEGAAILAIIASLLRLQIRTS